MMQRREFIMGCVAATMRPIATYAQQPTTMPIIGFLGTASAAAWSKWVGAFEQGLREHGLIKGQNVAIEYRWAEGRVENYAIEVAELVRLKVSVIVTAGAGVPAAKQAGGAIPIVFAFAPDPLGSGWVKSLARPGGNMTGISHMATDLSSKRIELLREFVPRLHRFAIMYNAAYPPIALEIEELHSAIRVLGLEAVPIEIRSGEDIGPAFAMINGRVDALYVPADPLVNSNRIRISALALDALLPTMFAFREYVEDGGLISYGPNVSDLFRRAADYVDKIFRGAKPADLPVEQATKFEQVINLRTAKALGIEVPPMLLARADEVVE
jgi:putative tryptophan/tyrosine transport system substrate-binding protein